MKIKILLFVLMLIPLTAFKTHASLIIGGSIDLISSDADYVYGVQIAPITKAKYCYVGQIGLLNTSEMGRGQAGAVNQADSSWAQLGMYNRSKRAYFLQYGAFNSADKLIGIQVGLINYTGSLNGIQLGLINIARHNWLQFFPVLNIGF